MKKILSIAAIIAAMAAVTACGSKAPATNTSTEATTAPAQTQSANEEEVKKGEFAVESTNNPGLFINAPEAGWSIVSDDENGMVISKDNDQLIFTSYKLTDDMKFPASEADVKEIVGSENVEIKDFEFDESEDGTVKNASYIASVEENGVRTTTVVDCSIIGDLVINASAITVGGDDARVTQLKQIVEELN